MKPQPTHPSTVESHKSFFKLTAAFFGCSICAESNIITPGTLTLGCLIVSLSVRSTPRPAKDSTRPIGHDIINSREKNIRSVQGYLHKENGDDLNEEEARKFMAVHPARL